jgi:RHS repeat-associated protein
MNGSKIWKHVWAANDRMGTQRDDGGIREVAQYFLHKDLQGSTNIVTDITGNTFQHNEYFATGEVWVNENSTVFRTPYQYGGGYTDEVRKVTNFGARWYDQNREMFYSPDPVLYDDPMAIVGAPTLRAAYAYGNSNPLTYIDPSGRQFTEAHQEFKAKLAQNPALRDATVDMLETHLPKSFVRLGLNIEKAELRQKKFKSIEDFAKPLVEINISTGEVKLSPGLYKQFTVRKGKDTNNATVQSAASNPADATNGSGGPAGNATAPVSKPGNDTSAPMRQRSNSVPSASRADSGKGTSVPMRQRSNSMPTISKGAKGSM